MLFHVDMIYLAKQDKSDVEKKLCFEMVTNSCPELETYMVILILNNPYFTAVALHKWVKIQNFQNPAL